jgi:hypothetical protein
METFFFLSLGISFILILLLVHHFKKRLNLLEQKCDTMFDIIQNVAKELKQIKAPVLQPVFRDVVEERIKYDMNEMEEEVQEEDDDETATMASEDEEEESESERETEEIVANKLEVFDLGEIQTELSTDTPTDYKKMSVPALKKLVLAKGLRNDVGGLKKADLLGLLA